MKKLIALLALLVVGCDDPTPGEIRLALISPNEDDGAIEIVAKAAAGYQITDISATCTACRVFPRVVSDEEIRAVITGTITNGLFITLTVSDRDKPGRYTVSFVSGASRTYDVRVSMGGYAVFPVQ